MLGAYQAGEVTVNLEMLKLLIADSGDGFRQALAEQLRDVYRIRVCREGCETLETMLEFKPDLVILDMMLPGLDGISILQEAHQRGLRPTVLAVTKYVNDFLVNAAGRLDVGYMMVKPCDVRVTVRRLRELAEYVHRPASSRPDLRTEVSGVLLALGISTKLRGYAYLREAILETVADPGQSMTKELYPAVGKICDASPIQVERSIRSAIEKAWKIRDEAVWRQYFQSAFIDKPERPTNAVFISGIADRLRMEREM